MINVDHGGSSHHGSVITNLTSIHEDKGLIPGLAQWVKAPALLWLWCRPAAATLIQLLDWELPYATGMALKSKKKKKKIYVLYISVYICVCVCVYIYFFLILSSIIF